MPEGHSIHRLARQFQDVFAGQVLSAASPQGRFAVGAARLDGRRLEQARAHGKQMFLDFDGGAVLRVHLGLYGAWDFGGDESFAGSSSIGAPRRIGESEAAPLSGAGYAGPPAPRGAVRLRLVSAHGWADLRGPTACQVLTVAEAEAVVAALGPDPLQNCDGDRADFVARVVARRVPIGQLLMDQNVLAGVGNVYRAELLFRAGVNPQRKGSTLPPVLVEGLWDDAVTLMRRGVLQGRIITTEADDLEFPAPDDVRAPAPTDVPVPAAADAHYVYKRPHLPCRRCGTPVRVTDMAGRKLYWCPLCQA